MSDKTTKLTLWNHTGILNHNESHWNHGQDASKCARLPALDSHSEHDESLQRPHPAASSSSVHFGRSLALFLLVPTWKTNNPKKNKTLNTHGKRKKISKMISMPWPLERAFPDGNEGFGVSCTSDLMSLLENSKKTPIKSNVFRINILYRIVIEV